MYTYGTTLSTLSRQVRYVRPADKQWRWNLCKTFLTGSTRALPNKTQGGMASRYGVMVNEGDDVCPCNRAHSTEQSSRQTPTPESKKKNLPPQTGFYLGHHRISNCYPLPANRHRSTVTTDHWVHQLSASEVNIAFRMDNPFVRGHNGRPSSFWKCLNRGLVVGGNARQGRCARPLRQRGRRGNIGCNLG